MQWTYTHNIQIWTNCCIAHYIDKFHIFANLGSNIEVANRELATLLHYYSVCGAGHHLQLWINEGLSIRAFTKAIAASRILVWHFKHSSRAAAELVKRQETPWLVVKMSFDEDKALKSLNDSTDASILNNNACLNPLDPEFKIPAEPIMLEIKWQRPGENQCRCALRFIVLSYSWNGYSKDFLRYDRVPEGVWEFLFFAIV